MMSLLNQPLSPSSSSGLFFQASAVAAGQQSPAADKPKERPFLCEEPGCDRRFNRKFTLSEHMKTHTGEKPYVCPLAECARRFSTSGNLARHKRLHASLKPFECDINGCKRSFPSQEKLDHHIKIHMGRRTHSCRVPGCAKTFSTAGNLTRHIKNRHPELTRSSAFPSYPFTPVHRPAVHAEMPSPQLLAAGDVLHKVEPVAPVFSPDSVEMAFHEELSAFQAAQFVSARPFTADPYQPVTEGHVGDVGRCSMSVLDEVIEFELTKDV